jgi:hypothetical protein
LLEYQVHGFDAVGGMTPVALRVEIAQLKLLLQPQDESRDRPRDLAGDEGFSP